MSDSHALQEDAWAVAPAPPAIQVSGAVQHGRKLGRTLGFPTANLRLGSQPPRFGVYAVRARLQGRDLEGVASVGVNPTVGEVEPVLEVFLFDFDEQIYGQTLSVDLVAYLREEQRFSGLEELIAQIGRDVEAARARLAAHGGRTPATLNAAVD